MHEAEMALRATTALQRDDGTPRAVTLGGSQAAVEPPEPEESSAVDMMRAKLQSWATNDAEHVKPRASSAVSQPNSDTPSSPDSTSTPRRRFASLPARSLFDAIGVDDDAPSSADADREQTPTRSHHSDEGEDSANIGEALSDSVSLHLPAGSKPIVLVGEDFVATEVRGQRFRTWHTVAAVRVPRKLRG